MRCSLSLLPVSTSSCKLIKVNSFPLQAGNGVWDNANIWLIIQEFTVTWVCICCDRKSARLVWVCIWIVSCLKEYSCKIKDLNNFFKILFAFKGLMRRCHLLKFKKWEKCNFVCLLEQFLLMFLQILWHNYTCKWVEQNYMTGLWSSIEWTRLGKLSL